MEENGPRCEGAGMLKQSILSATCLAAMTLTAFADVRYTTKISTPGANTSATTMTTWVKGKRQRMEMVTEVGTFKSKTVTLTLCDTHQNATLDPDLKIYMLTPMDIGDGKPAGGAVGTGTMTATYTVKDLGVETVAKLKAHHWLITTRYVATGCAGNSDTTNKVEVWTYPIEVLNCWENNTYSQPTCRVKFIETGDVKGMRAAYNGMPIKLISYQGETKTSVQEMVDYSTDKIDPAIVSLPKDYKEVSAAEFQQQQQQKMMKQYQVPTTP